MDEFFRPRPKNCFIRTNDFRYFGNGNGKHYYYRITEPGRVLIGTKLQENGEIGGLRTEVDIIKNRRITVTLEEGIKYLKQIVITFAKKH